MASRFCSASGHAGHASVLARSVTRESKPVAADACEPLGSHRGCRDRPGDVLFFWSSRLGNDLSALARGSLYGKQNRGHDRCRCGRDDAQRNVGCPRQRLAVRRLNHRRRPTNGPASSGALVDWRVGSVMAERVQSSLVQTMATNRSPRCSGVRPPSRKRARVRVPTRMVRDSHQANLGVVTG